MDSQWDPEYFIVDGKNIEISLSEEEFEHFWRDYFKSSTEREEEMEAMRREKELQDSQRRTVRWLSQG